MIKKVIKIFAIEVLALYIINQLISGLVFENGIKTFLITAVALSIAAYLVKPIINLLSTFLLDKILLIFLIKYISNDKKIIEIMLKKIIIPVRAILSNNFEGKDV
jgi:uncharacterized membrane protein YvlD (DUF360 family)